MTETSGIKNKRNWRLALWATLFVILLLLFKLVAYTMCINLAIFLSTRDRVYKDSQLAQLPPAEYGLLLGTSERVRGGAPNPHFWNRIEAAVQLYQQGKVQKIIASGDPRPGRQNEVAAMQKALVARGIPQENIIQDNLGRRTLASIQQTRALVKDKKVIIISQEYHNYRALYLANFYSLNAQAYCAKTPPLNQSFKTQLREIAARVKAVIDITKISFDSFTEDRKS